MEFPEQPTKRFKRTNADMKITREAIRQYLSDGHSYSQIRDLLGVSRATIAEVAHDIHLEAARDENLERVVQQKLNPDPEYDFSGNADPLPEPEPICPAIEECDNAHSLRCNVESPAPCVAYKSKQLPKLSFAAAKKINLESYMNHIEKENIDRVNDAKDWARRVLLREARKNKNNMQKFEIIKKHF